MRSKYLAIPLIAFAAFCLFTPPAINANNDKPSSKKRLRRYRHSANLSMFKVTVKNGASIKKTIMVRDLGMSGADLRIMIWLEPWV